MPTTTYNETGAPQTFTATVAGTYAITASGAQGGQNINATRAVGGLGAMVSGNIYLAAGAKLEIIVGGVGGNGTSGSEGGGGGGGSFVIETSTNGTDAVSIDEIIAGGGGGATYMQLNSGHGGTTTKTGGAGGPANSGGAGGVGGSNHAAGDGGGRNGGGGGGRTGGAGGTTQSAGGDGSSRGSSFAGGAPGGAGGYGFAGGGGYGGGGGGGGGGSGSHINGFVAGGGGGGGYGGGGGGGGYEYAAGSGGVGGGGGSYVISTATQVTMSPATHSGNGLVKITRVVPTITSEAATPTGKDLNAGKIVTFTIGTNEAVRGGSNLTLSNGATAFYQYGNGTAGSPLIYNYTVLPGDKNIGDLQATALNGNLTDGAGNVLDTSTFAAIDTGDQVDTVAPTVTVSTTSGSPTTTASIPFTFNFSEPVTGFVASDVTVTNGTLSALTGSGKSYSGTVTPSAGGTVTVSVPANEVQDLATNGNTASNSVSVQYNMPVTATPVLNMPANNALTNTTEPTYTGTAAAGSTVTVYVDYAAIGTTTATSGGAFSLTQPTNLAQGSHTASAMAQLNGYDVSRNSNIDMFVVDTTPPAAPATPADAAVVNGFVNAANDTAGQTLTGTAEGGSTVKIYDGSTLVDTTTASGTAGTTGTWSYNVGVLGDGTSHSYTATATDAAGNTSARSGALTFRVDTVAPTVPGMTATTSAGTSDIKAGASVTFTLTGSEALTIGTGAALTLNNGATATYTTGSGTTTPTFIYNVVAGQDTSDLTITGYTGTITDAAGNALAAGEVTGDIGFRVDTTAPTGTGSQSDGAYTKAASDTLTVSATDPNGATGSGVASVQFYDNGTAIGAPVTAADGNGHYVYAATGLAEGTNSFTAVVTDKAGNASSTVTVGSTLVDTTAPAVTPTPTVTAAVNGAPVALGLTTPTDNLTASGDLAIAVTSLPTDGTVKLASGTAVAANQSLSATDLAGLTFTPTADAAGETSSFTYSVTDQAGNSAQGTAALDIAAAVLPTIAGTAPLSDGAEAPVPPFAHATLTDPNDSANDTLTIALTGGGGKLAEGAGVTGGTLKAAGTNSYTLTGTAAAIQAELQALTFQLLNATPGATVSTTLALTLASGAGTISAVDAATVVTDTAAPPPPSGGGAPAPTPVPTTPVTTTPPTTTPGGTDPGGAGPGPVTTPGEPASGVVSLPAGTVDDPSSSQPQAPTTSTITGITGQPYTSVETQYDVDGRPTAQTFLGPAGHVFKNTSTDYGADGSAATTTSGGAYFTRRPFFAYVDRFAADGTQTEEDVFFKDGHQTVQGLVPGATLASIANDTFLTAPGGSNTFVFTPGFGQDVVTSFQVRGPDHDTISLPDSAQARLGVILAQATTDAAGDAVLHLNRNDTIAIQGVDVAELRHHRQDFTFHA